MMEAFQIGVVAAVGLVVIGIGIFGDRLWDASFERKRRELMMFICKHKHYSRVFTDPKTNEKYVICWDCKREVPYDWEKMEIISECPAKSV